MEIQYIIIHHTAVSRDENSKQYEAVKNTHIVEKKWGDIGYHYFIEPDGLLMKGRNENVTGAHCIEERMNYQSIGICIAGNFDKEKPTDEQLKTLKDIITHLRIKYDIPRENIKFHKDFSKTKCAGINFTRELLLKYMPLLELKRDIRGGFWFIKKGDNGKQKISTADAGVAGMLTVISREFGVDTMPDRYFDKLETKKYF